MRFSPCARSWPRRAAAAKPIYRAWRSARFELVTATAQLDELRRASRYPKLKAILPRTTSERWSTTCNARSCCMFSRSSRKASGRTHTHRAPGRLLRRSALSPSLLFCCSARASSVSTHAQIRARHGCRTFADGASQVRSAANDPRGTRSQ